MTPTQGMIFDAILEYREKTVETGIDDWPTMAFLTHKFGVTRGTMSTNIKRMVDAGFLKYKGGWERGQSKKVMFINA